MSYQLSNINLLNAVSSPINKGDSNFFNKIFTEDEGENHQINNIHLETLTPNRYLENRPTISNVDNNLELINKNELINKPKEVDQGDILNQPLKKVIHNTINSISNFPKDFKKYLAKTEQDLYNGNTDHKFIDIIKIHCVAFIQYLKNDYNCIYIGIALVFLSILIYMFNIIRE